MGTISSQQEHACLKGVKRCTWLTDYLQGHAWTQTSKSGRVRAPQPVHLLLGSQSYARMDCLVCAYDGSKNGSTESSGLTCASQLDTSLPM